MQSIYSLINYLEISSGCLKSIQTFINTSSACSSAVILTPNYGAELELVQVVVVPSKGIDTYLIVPD